MHLSYWLRRRIGGWLTTIHSRVAARSAIRESQDGICILDLVSEPAGFDRIRIAAESLRVLHYYDVRRYNRLRRYIQQIEITDMIGPQAVFALGTRVCMVHPRLLDLGTATVAATLVHEATHGRLDRLHVRQDEERRGRVERLCIAEEIDFVRRFPMDPALSAWIERRTNLADTPTLDRGSV